MTAETVADYVSRGYKLDGEAGLWYKVITDTIRIARKSYAGGINPGDHYWEFAVRYICSDTGEREIKRSRIKVHL